MARAASGSAPTIRYNTYAEAADVLALEPDVVFVATGGMPDTEVLEEGNDLVISSWDVVGGSVAAAGRVLVYDDNGNHPGMQAAEVLAEAGAEVELVTPERMLAPEIGGLNHAAYARIFHRRGVRVTMNTRLLVGAPRRQRAGGRAGQRLRRAARRSAGSTTWWSSTARCRSDELYEALKPGSRNGGEVDYRRCSAAARRRWFATPDGAFQLFRIGDAVASRNIHAAIFDALRLAKDL